MSIGTAGAFSKTLKDVTDIKLGALSKKKARYATLKKDLIARAEAAPTLREKVEILLKGFKDLQKTGYAGEGDSVAAIGSLSNLKHFLQQAEHDPAVGRELLTTWEEGLKKSLETNSVKFEFASLFGKLLTQWLETFDQKPEVVEAGAEVRDNDIDMMYAQANFPVKNFEEIGRKEMHEQRALFEEYVFKKRTSDEKAVTDYLENIFSLSPASKLALKNCRESLEKVKTLSFDKSDMKSAIKGLLGESLLGDEKAATLKQFLNDDTVLEEVADVVSMNMAAYETWDWDPTEPVLLEMRRQLNGKYRVFMDEDILEAIFLHAIGERWKTILYYQFKSIHSTTWKNATPEMGRKEREFRRYFVNDEGSDRIALTRDTRNEGFFLTMIKPKNDNDSDSDSDDSYTGEGGATNPEMTKDSKTTLLHLLSTEARINMAIHGQHTIVRTDFKWFGPSLPHSSIIAVLKFFGVHESWLGFFKRFLAAPLKFKSDGAKGEIRRRETGVPMSHVLATVFGESVMFCMDFAFNQAADGLFLYRIHDDLWFMDHRQELCVKGWKEMQKYAKLVGLQFNEEKTGSICINPKGDNSTSLSSSLPPGDIKWGFMKMEKNGQFVVDQEEIDTHTAELKRQLAACKSVFSWVQAWNKYYASFLPRNFGKPALSFGVRHVDLMIDSLEKVQHEIFPEHGSATAYIKSILAKDFEVDPESLPDGWFYWPIGMGGLGIINPMVNLYAIRRELKKKDQDVDKRIENVFESERVEYDRKKKSWEDGADSRRHNRIPAGAESGKFMTFEEFTKYRERTSHTWASLYSEFLRDNFSRTPVQTPAIEKALASISYRNQGRNKEMKQNFAVMSEYWKWTVALYAPEMESKFGGLEVVTPGILPVGMVEAFRGLKISWEQ